MVSEFEMAGLLVTQPKLEVTVQVITA